LREKLFLDQTRTCEAQQRVGAAGFIVCATCAAAAEALLADEGGCGLAV